MPKKGTVVEEYLVKITPYFDNKEYSNIMKNIQKLIDGNVGATGKSKPSKSRSQSFLKNLANITSVSSKSATQNLSKNLNSASKNAMQLGSSMGGAAVSAMAVVAAVKVIYDVMKKVVELSTEFSNKMITASSSFVDKDVRNLMARFGVSSQTATGIQSVLDLMGISPEDMKLMTPGQLDLFAELMKQWNEGINSIDKSKMDKFNSVMQNFQKEMASAKLELQIKFYETLISLAPQLEAAGEGIITMIEYLAKILQLPPLKWGLTILAYGLKMLAKALELILSVIGYGWLWGTDSSIENSKSNVTGNTTNNSVTINAQTNNQFMGDNATMINLASNVPSTTSQITEKQILRTGRN